MTKNLMIVLIVLGAVGGAWWHGDRHGTTTCEAQYTEAENELRKQLDKLKAEAVERVREHEDEVATLRRESDELLQELRRKDEELDEYLDTPVPNPALDYAFGGVRDDGE